MQTPMRLGRVRNGICLVLCLLADLAGVRAGEAYAPGADPRAEVISGHARFTVITSRLIRLEWSAEGKFEDRASLVFLNRRLPPPDFTRDLSPAGLVLHTADLDLRYSPAAGSDGRFTPENLSITLRLNGQPVRWHPGLPDTGNLLGTTRTLDGARGGRTREPMGPGLISRDGWVLVDDSVRPLFDSADFRFASGEDSPWPWVVSRPAGERQDWYFFGYGHAFRAALGDFVRVAGRIPLPPRFAFGAWWSRYWAYDDQELNELVRGFHRNDVPLDVLVIDMDWHPTLGMHFDRLDASGHTLGWTGYSWNRVLFPDPEDFLRHLHAEGLKVTLNLHPASGIQPWEDRYPAMARAMGINPATKQYVRFDLTDQKFARNYMNLILHPLERQGVDFWWLDWQQEPTTAMPELNPTWWLNYVHFTDQEREGKRPMLFHRWGGLGNHRYQIGFSGDTVSVWESLAFQPGFTATAANVGYAYWSHDIGGHMPGQVEPELYTRWVQFGAFSPILRTHTTKNAEAERRIWAYPEPYADIMRDTFRLRYALQPYLYTEARRTYDTGVAFLRPLYYDWPEAPAAYAQPGEYRFGEELIAAPITRPVDPTTSLARQDLWLPPGEWWEWPTGRRLVGPGPARRFFSVAQIPVYVRAGAILPMERPPRATTDGSASPLILTVFPPADGQTTRYTLYEDGGEGEAYQNGACAWTDLEARRTGDELVVRVGPARGRFSGIAPTRRYELHLPGDWPPTEVLVDGQALTAPDGDGGRGWRFEGNTLTTVIVTPPAALTQGLEIRIRRAAGSEGRRELWDGFAGAIARLRGAYEALNQDWPHTWSPDVLIEAWQTGDRLSYRPETAAAESVRFPALYGQALAAVAELVAEANVSDQDLVKRVLGLPDNWRTESGAQQAARYRTAVCRALALLQDGQPPQR